MSALAAPKNISPLIRAGRWGALLFGIYYGHSKLNSLRVSDEPKRKAAIQKATKEHQEQLEKTARTDKEGMMSLAKEAGVKVN